MKNIICKQHVDLDDQFDKSDLYAPPPPPPGTPPSKNMKHSHFHQDAAPPPPPPPPPPSSSKSSSSSRRKKKKSKGDSIVEQRRKAALALYNSNELMMDETEEGTASILSPSAQQPLSTDPIKPSSGGGSVQKSKEFKKQQQKLQKWNKQQQKNKKRLSIDTGGSSSTVAPSTPTSTDSTDRRGFFRGMLHRRSRSPSPSHSSSNGKQMGIPFHAAPGTSYKSTPHSAEIVPRRVKTPTQSSPSADPKTPRSRTSRDAPADLEASSVSTASKQEHERYGVVEFNDEEECFSPQNFQGEDECFSPPRFSDDISHLTDPTFERAEEEADVKQVNTMTTIGESSNGDEEFPGGDDGFYAGGSFWNEDSSVADPFCEEDGFPNPASSSSVCSNDAHPNKQDPASSSSVCSNDAHPNKQDAPSMAASTTSSSLSSLSRLAGKKRRNPKSRHSPAPLPPQYQDMPPPPPPPPPHQEIANDDNSIVSAASESPATMRALQIMRSKAKSRPGRRGEATEAKRSTNNSKITAKKQTKKKVVATNAAEKPPVATSKHVVADSKPVVTSKVNDFWTEKRTRAKPAPELDFLRPPSPQKKSLAALRKPRKNTAPLARAPVLSNLSKIARMRRNPVMTKQARADSNAKVIQSRLPQHSKSPPPHCKTLSGERRPKSYFKTRNVSIEPHVVEIGLKVIRSERQKQIDLGHVVPIVPVKTQKIAAIPWAPSKQFDESKMDPIQRAGFRLLSKAAIPIQTTARRYLAQREAVDRLWAIIELQSYVRRWRCETYLLAHNWAAVILQKCFRGWKARTIIVKRTKASIDIQRVVRGYLASIRVYDDFYRLILLQSVVRGWIGRRKAAVSLKKVVTVQSFCRMCLARFNIERKQLAATAIQNAYRTYSAQLHFQFDIVDIILVQSMVRRWKAMKITSKMRTSKEDAAAIVLQKTWRGFQAYTDYIFSIADILVVQRTVRVWLARKETKRMRHLDAILKIQGQWRKYKAQMNALYKLVHIIIVQSVIRRHLAAKRVREYRLKLWAAGVITRQIGSWCRVQKYKKTRLYHESATKIQASWRGFWHFSHYLILSYEIVRIQSVYRGYRARRESNLQLGCAIIIQSIMRRVLCRNEIKERRMNLVLIGWKVNTMRENVSAKRIARWWKYGKKAKRDNRAAEVIQGFFRMVKAMVDTEIRRQAKTKKKKGKKKRGKESDEKMLERAWLKSATRSSTCGKSSMAGTKHTSKSKPSAVNVSVADDAMSDVTSPSVFNRVERPRATTFSSKQLRDDLSLEEAWIDTEVRQVKDRRAAQMEYLQRHGLQYYGSYRQDRRGQYTEQGRPHQHQQMMGQHNMPHRNEMHVLPHSGSPMRSPSPVMRMPSPSPQVPPRHRDQSPNRSVVRSVDRHLSSASQHERSSLDRSSRHNERSSIDRSRDHRESPHRSPRRQASPGDVHYYQPQAHRAAAPPRQSPRNNNARSQQQYFSGAYSLPGYQPPSPAHGAGSNNSYYEKTRGYPDSQSQATPQAPYYPPPQQQQQQHHQQAQYSPRHYDRQFFEQDRQGYYRN